jgi:hypothetical protein
MTTRDWPASESEFVCDEDALAALITISRWSIDAVGSSASLGMILNHNIALNALIDLQILHAQFCAKRKS